MTSLPSSIRVGHLDFQVEAWPAIQASASERYGECDHINQTIRVRVDLPPQRQATILLHEILHGAYSAGDLSSGDSEEKVVTVLANLLTAVWRDNPEFVQFMEGSLR